jgi:hypothetical protein
MYLALGAGLLLVMALGGWIGQQIREDFALEPSVRDCDFAALVVGGLALAAYLLWFRAYLLNPGELAAILFGGMKPSRTSAALVTGVTSLVNCAPAFFSLYAWRNSRHGSVHVPRWLRGLFWSLVVLTTFRVYAWGERLALIEAALPLALIFSVRAMHHKSAFIQYAVRLGPFIALPLLLLYFGLAESLRSWDSPTYNGKMSFWEFAVGRLASYYFTSLNNGAGFLATTEWPSLKFEHVLGMFHSAPLHVGEIFAEVVGSSGSPFPSFLASFGDPEFNNPSGLFTTVYDLGIPGAIAYFALIGVMAGVAFRLFERGTLLGALLYPPLFISYLEVFRYTYLGTGRAFSWMLAIVLIAVLTLRSRPRALSA